MPIRTRCILPALAALALFAFVHAAQWRYLASPEGQGFHLGQPIMATNDSYLYLREARALLEGLENEGWRRPSAPLLPWVAANAAWITGATIDQVAFVLPLALGLLMLVPYLGFAAAARAPRAGWLAFVAVLGSIYYYARSRLGYFDTDQLNPVLMYGALLAVLRFTLAKGPRGRIFWLAVFVGICFLADAWWPQVRGLALLLGLAGYGLGLPFSTSRTERVVQGLALVLLAIGALLLFSPPELGPDFLRPWLIQAKSHVDFLLRRTDPLFPQAALSIGELKRPELAVLGQYLQSFPLALRFSVVGLVLLALTRPRVFLALAPGLGLGLLSFLSYRFVLFLAPSLALGLGYGLVYLSREPLLERFLPQPFLRGVFMTALGVLLLLPGVVTTSRSKLPPAYSPDQVRMAEKLIPVSGEPVIWSSWGLGYFLEYYSGKPALFNGGTMSPDMLYVAAKPLSMSDPKAAARWMRFIGKYYIHGWRFVLERVAGPAEAAGFLEEFFAAPERAAELLGKYGVREPADPKWWTQYLLPDESRPVYLYLDPTMMSQLKSWYYEGTWDFETRDGTMPEFFKIENAGERVHLDEHYVQFEHFRMRYGRHITLTAEGSEIERVNDIFPGTLITTPNPDLAFFMGVNVRDSLVSRLLLEDAKLTPCLRPYAWEQLSGGWWRVEACP